jgi:hypothetical protein
MILHPIAIVVVEITSSEPADGSRIVTTTTPVETREILNPETNPESLVLNQANLGTWSNTAKRFDAYFHVNLTINTFEQVRNPNYETTGGYKL